MCGMWHHRSQSVGSTWESSKPSLTYVALLQAVYRRHFLVKIVFQVSFQDNKQVQCATASSTDVALEPDISWTLCCEWHTVFVFGSSYGLTSQQWGVRQQWYVFNLVFMTIGVFFNHKHLFLQSDWPADIPAKTQKPVEYDQTVLLVTVLPFYIHPQGKRSEHAYHVWGVHLPLPQHH